MEIVVGKIRIGANNCVFGSWMYKNYGPDLNPDQDPGH